MSNCNSEKNRTVKTQSKHLVNSRRGRKIPRESIQVETQLSNISTNIQNYTTDFAPSLYVAPFERTPLVESLPAHEVNLEEAQRILNQICLEYAQLRATTQTWSSGVNMIPTNFIYGNHEYRE